jgi:hypothetical protein
MRGGDTSAMNMGDTTDASPTPTPPKNRNRSNSRMLVGSADPIEPAANSRPEKMRVGLRPQRSLSMPPRMGPAMQPNNALAIANPSPNGFSPNSGTI